MKSERYIRFTPFVSFRGIPEPHLFNIVSDELYALDEDGRRFVKEVEDGTPEEDITDREILEFALSEGLVERSSSPASAPLQKGQSPVPSLRYLELLLTMRCNLRCRHCYQGGPEESDMDPETLDLVLSEFDDIQGLRLLISGGEPLMYPHLDRLCELLQNRGYRSVLLTNGVALSRSLLADAPFHEVQVSLDGLDKGHDWLRGAGTFQKAVASARQAVDAGLDLSVASMVHPENLEEMDGLEDLVRELGALEWSIEVPTEAGRWQDRPELLEKAPSHLARGFGGSYHGSAEGFACGHHLAAITPEGRLLKCGFYEDRPLGHVSEGLREVWSRKPVLKVADIRVCRDCEYAGECGGGCRFRAGEGPDPVMCAAYGFPQGRSFPA
ncbi:MAG: radical SAM protein [bacterium]